MPAAAPPVAEAVAAKLTAIGRRIRAHRKRLGVSGTTAAEAAGMSRVTLYRIERPVLFYGSIGAMLVALAIVLAVPLAITYAHTGLVPRVPTAILVTGIIIVAVLCFFAGLILDTVTRGRREVRRLAYLSLEAPR